MKRQTAEHPDTRTDEQRRLDASLSRAVHLERIDSDEGVRAVAPHVVEISRGDLMPAHEATATKRLERLHSRS